MKTTLKTVNRLLLTAACLLSIFSSSAQSIPSYIPSNGLVGWWPFNGNANDESGNGNNGTVNGATLTADRFGNAGKAYSFDGINTFISGNCSNFPATQRTISFWFYSPLQAENSFFLGYGGGVIGTSFGLYANAQGCGIQGQNAIGYSSHGCVNNFHTGYPPSVVNNWTNLVFTTNNSDTRIYLNGELKNSVSVSLATTNTSGKNYIFGGQIDWDGLGLLGVESDFLGSLDDIAIWNRALSAQEITSLYQSGSAGNGGTAGSSKAFPKGISYQAQARNAQGQPLLNTALQLRFTLISDSASGSSEYVETQSLSSNAQGLINTSIGNGTAQSGTWAAINWAAGRKFLRAEINAGSGFVNLGTQEMLSVPFSQRSKSADAIDNSGLPVYNSNSEAKTAGLRNGQMYRTASGVLMVVYQ